MVMSIKCPICGNHVNDLYDICNSCGWEYDGCTRWNKKSSANHMYILVGKFKWIFKKLFK